MYLTTKYARWLSQFPKSARSDSHCQFTTQWLLVLEEFRIQVSLHDTRSHGPAICFQCVGQEGLGKIHLETTTAFHARHRNVGGSNLIGSFRSSIWLLHSNDISFVHWFICDGGNTGRCGIHYADDYLRLLAFAAGEARGLLWWSPRLYWVLVCVLHPKSYYWVYFQ